jgi:poly(A) polymerase
MNSDGDIYDPFDGISDLNSGTVKFIGDPEKRIKEDYLRILRYYRFLSFYDSSVDSETRRLIKKNASSIVNLSSERIHMEFFKILDNDNSGKIINFMEEDGILELIFSYPVDVKVYNRMIDIDNELFFNEDILLKFVTLIPENIDEISNLKCFNFSNKEKKIIDLLINSKNEIKSYQSVKEVRAILYKLGIDNFVRLTRLYWAKDKKISNISQWRALLAMGHSWKAPKFPIEAKDILLLGVPEGPLVGEILNEVENWWIDSDFIEDKASLFERIKAIVGAKI